MTVEKQEFFAEGEGVWDYNGAPWNSGGAPWNSGGALWDSRVLVTVHFGTARASLGIARA